jgi:hypothetical protein
MTIVVRGVAQRNLNQRGLSTVGTLFAIFRPLSWPGEYSGRGLALLLGAGDR